ncbi:MAG: hypothetical protein EXS31_10925, partial [Pedosphaera sp.]|nr:hypothetical protein [Pedosphaera sp.]
MNAPDKPVIAFLQWPKGDAQLPPERKLPLVGFNRDRTALLVYDERDRRCALRLAPPSLFNIRYHEAPLAENSTPVAIRRTVLHEPPCRQTRKQAERLLSPNQLSSLEGMSLWEKFAPVVQHLAGTEAEDRELSRRFEAHKKRRLAEYEDRLRHIEELPAEQKEKEKKHLEGLFMTARPGRPQSGEKPLSEFDVTLDDVKAGALGIRDEYLIQKFCRSYGFDRTEIKENSERFRHWLAGVAHREGVDDPNRPERIPLHALASWLEALEAAVRYELSFANGRKVWLEAVEETTVLSPQDGEDFDAQEAEA